jgi:hypothetical protein
MEKLPIPKALTKRNLPPGEITRVMNLLIEKAKKKKIPLQKGLNQDKK